ncbi:MAG: PKD domain-containing protein [Sphingobacteriales bacterium]|nr:PKD domain-containing protein [Sphingobacteriales bacterium]
MTPQNLAKIIILWLSANILYTNITTLAQTPKYFWNTYGSSGDIKEIDSEVLVYNDSLFIVSAKQLDFVSSATKILLWGIDGKGNMIWQKSFGEEEAYNRKSKINLTPQKNINFITYAFPNDTNKVAVSHFIEVDSKGETIIKKVIQDSISNKYTFFYNILNVPNGYLLSRSSFYIIDNDIKPKPNLVKINYSGEMIWHRQFPEFDSGFIKNLTPANDGGYYLSGSYEKEENRDIFLIKTDSLGNDEWKTSKDSVKIENFEQTHEINKDTLVGIFKYFIEEENKGTMYIAKFDKNFNIFSYSPEFNEKTTALLQNHQDHTWIGVAPFLEGSIYIGLEFFKLDAQGNLLWRRLYGKPAYSFYDGGDIQTLSDGSFVIVSSKENGKQSDVILFKVNCMGLQTEPQAYFETEITETSNILRFHNLSTAVYPDSTDGGHFVWDFGDGNTSSLQNPEHSYDRSGTYRVVLKGIVCKDTSVYHQDIFVKVPPPANYQWQLSSLHNRQGTLSLLYDIPEEGNHSFRLYDMLGREVLQQTLLSATRGAADIPLSALSAGSYVACLYKDNERIFIQKIILQ